MIKSTSYASVPAPDDETCPELPGGMGREGKRGQKWYPYSSKNVAQNWASAQNEQFLRSALQGRQCPWIGTTFFFLLPCAKFSKGSLTFQAGNFEALAQVVNLHEQLASRLSFWQLNWSVLCRLESQDPERERCLRLFEKCGLSVPIYSGQHIQQDLPCKQ